MKSSLSICARVLIAFYLFIGFLSCAEEDEANEEIRYTLSIKKQLDIEEVDVLIEDLLLNYDIAGASLAVSKDERMVYAKGYGLANIETNIKTQKYHTFRLADLSKLFTAAAILKLVEEGQLDLSDRIFGSRGIMSHQIGNHSSDITVEHLLVHMISGWGEEIDKDLMSHYRTVDNEYFLNSILENWPVEIVNDKPNYNHVGYFILGRVIEEVTGIGALAYIKKELTDPIGVMSLDRTFFTEFNKVENEVSYYAKGNQDQYVYSIAPRRDTDIGFTCSATDLLRFACSIDGRSNKPDVLNNELLPILFQSVLTKIKVDCPVSNYNDTFLSGSIPGVYTQLIISSTGVNAVLLLNGSIDDDSTFTEEIEHILSNLAHDNSLPWQSDLDLF